MLQLKLHDTVSYISRGNEHLEKVYWGTNVSDAEVRIIHHDRRESHELSPCFAVSISHHLVPAPYIAKVFKNMEDAKRWAETQVSMSWDIGEEV